jgi:hypothetical protein
MYKGITFNKPKIFNANANKIILKKIKTAIFSLLLFVLGADPFGEITNETR